ncbi:protease modulator HflC [Phycisphaerales bacterium AB-hyl4]|uniref:Protein HflC n=1 Tax=Natronomicrosphaera hydrolytica TaxID=3242702 RepID=A0ABV4U3Q0_9BACT
MKNQLVLLIGILVFVVLLAYMFTFQVRYDEVAVLATFERTAAPERDPETGAIRVDPTTGEPTDPGSLIYTPGLRFKAPWPIQKVYTYPRKIQVLEIQPEQVQTDDGHAIIVMNYVTWRIADPHQFYQTLRTIEQAEQTLRPVVRDVRGSKFGEYRFTDLVNVNPDQVRLAEIEQAMTEELRDRLAEGANYGVAIEQVGIRRIVLPADTTELVFQRMRTTRERLASAAREEGQAQAGNIRSQAESARERILAFAERRAQAIRDEGNREAAAAFEDFSVDEDFAIFLRQIETLRATLAHNTTFMLDADSLSFLNLFKDDPSGESRPPEMTRDMIEQQQTGARHDDE